MLTSLFLAKVFSIYLVVIGAACLVRREWFKDAVAELFDNKAVMLIWVIFGLILGIILIVVHPLFTADWRSVISVLCWLVFFKAAVYLFVGDAMFAWKRALLTKNGIYYVAGTVCILVGIFLGYHGFWLMA